MHKDMASDSKDNIEPAALLQVPKYRIWKNQVEKSGCTLQKVEVVANLTKPNGSVLFALLRTRVEDSLGRPLPAYALLRGHACLIVTVIENSETHERQFLMIRQRRIGHGGESLEFPAGMLDEDVHDALGVAVRELQEETGLDIPRESIFPLCDRPLYSSPGLDDEAIHYFTCTVILKPEEMASLEGGERGQAEEHEHIQLCLLDEARALKEVNSLQVRLAFFLYAEHMRQGNKS